MYLIGIYIWIYICFNDIVSYSSFQSTPYFRTLVESGSRYAFERQFRTFENQSSSKQEPREVNITDRVLKDIDMTVNPCNDFYSFVCGGFIKSSGRPNGADKAFVKPVGKITTLVKRALETKIHDTDYLSLRKAKILFNTCMDKHEIEKRGIQPVLQFLKDRGGWPVLGNWDHQNFNFIDLLAQTRPLLKDYQYIIPSGIIIGTSIQLDFRKKGKFAIYLDQPSFGQFRLGAFLNIEVYRLGKTSIYNTAYEDYLVDLAVLLGADIQTAKKDMCDVMKFETELAKISLKQEERRMVDKMYNKVSILELSLKYPKIDWLRYLQKLMSIKNIKVDLSTEVVLWASTYYDKLTGIIEKTSQRTLANYILFRAIQPLLSSLTKSVRYLNLRYVAVVNGEYEPRLPERSDFCTRVVLDQMDWLASRLFVEQYEHNETIEQVQEIKKHVRYAYTSQISFSNWLSSGSKRSVLRKMNSIKDKIGYPNDYLQKEYLDKIYKNVQFGKYFFENIEEILIENYRNVVSELIYPPKDDWLIRPSTVNAWFNLGTNSIEITLGVLNDPFFGQTHPAAMKFGSIGGVIGHEYGHAFGDISRRVNWDGIISSYWSDLSLSIYETKANCFIQQYSKYYIPKADLHIVNGNKTLIESMSDQTGLKAAFYAYQNWRRTRKIGIHNSGFPFTDDQLFFIGWSRIWCENVTPIYQRKVPLLDHHPLNQLRVIGPLQNMPEFARTFNCPLGSLMNPTKKCSFW